MKPWRRALKYLLLAFTLIMLAGIMVAIQSSGHISLMLRLWSENVAITFYGQVIDQQGNPVVGASVKTKIMYFDVTTVFETGRMVVWLLQTLRSRRSGGLCQTERQSNYCRSAVPNVRLRLTAACGDRRW